MKYVLAEIINGKIHGLYGGRNYKYTDVINYICSSDIHGCSYKIDNLDKVINIRNRLNSVGYSFEIIVVETD